MKNSIEFYWSLLAADSEYRANSSKTLHQQFYTHFLVPPNHHSKSKYIKTKGDYNFWDIVPEE